MASVAKIASYSAKLPDGIRMPIRSPRPMPLAANQATLASISAISSL